MRYLCPVLLFLLIFIQVSMAVDSPFSCTEQKWHKNESHSIIIVENCTFNATASNMTIEVVNKKGGHLQNPKEATINGREIKYEYSEPEIERYANNAGILSFRIPSSYLNGNGENSLWLKYEIDNQAENGTDLENYDFSEDIMVYPFEYYPSLEITANTTPFEKNVSTVTFTITNRGENDAIPDLGLTVYSIRLLNIRTDDIYSLGHALLECKDAFFCQNASVGILPLPFDINYSMIPEKIREDNELEYALRRDLIHPGVIIGYMVDDYAPIKFYLFNGLKLEKDQQISFSFNVSFDSSQKPKKMPYSDTNVAETTAVYPFYRYVRNTSLPGEYDLIAVNVTNYTKTFFYKGNPRPNNSFVYILEETDGLIGEYTPKHKMGLVFVPIGYGSNESEEFKDVARKSAERFVSTSPFEECDSPNDQIDVYTIDPSVCNITGCNNICGGDDAANDCQALVDKCSMNIKNQFDYIVGLCKGTSCGGKCGGCANNIPSRSVVVNTVNCGGADASKIVTHELGHAMGLYHISSTFGVNDCWDHEGGACQGPNAEDCNLDDENISRDIMAYCPSMESYGSTGYGYLKNNVFLKYMDGCYK
ncbi:MAG: hypothetical protein NTY68_03925 [Candidatus Micrarchaeota archaeon]|nr:hypothetical protein [Candidatus Micrarchaeota archaeon]